MINHIIEYFKISHPLKKSEGSIVISDPEKLSQRCFKAFLDDKKSSGPAELPRILRVLVSPEENPNPEDIELVKRFERNAEIQDSHFWNLFKLRIFLKFTAACGVGYFIYWTIFNFPWFWVPATVFLENILGDTLTKIFQGVVIAFVPGLSFIKNFVGAKRWNRVNSRSQYTRIYSKFGKSSREYFVREVKKCLRNIKEAAEEEKAPLEIAPIKNILEEILGRDEVRLDFARDWLKRFEEILEDLSQRAKKEPFLEGVVLKLDGLKNDLVLHYLEGFQMVPLKVARVNLSPEEFFPLLEQNFDLSQSLLAEGFREKAKNLRSFLNETSSIRERIYSDFDSLKEAKEKKERIKILESIEEGFENLRNIAGNFHFGDNPYITQERGENLSNFYDRLYLLFGKAKLDILEGKKAVKGVLIRWLRIKSEWKQKRRIKELTLKVERLLSQGITTKKFYEKISHLFSFFGKDLKRSLVFSGVVLFAFASLLSFKTLGPEEVLTTTYLRWGVKETATQKVPLFSRGVKVYRFGQGLPIFPGKELFWQLPPPLVYTHKIDFNQPQEFTSYMIFKAPADTLYKKGLGLLAGIYGEYFQIVEINFDFLPKDKETWISYDYDGKGTKRLARDITSIIDEWRGQFFDWEESPLIEDEKEREEIFSGPYFKKLWDEGRMEEIIKAWIFKSPVVTYYYGTYSEMITPGIDLILTDLEREKKEVKDSFLPKEEKEKKIAKIEEFKDKVEKIKEEALEEAKKEHGALRKFPQELKKYLSEPESISELREFETVWFVIERTMFNQYIIDKLMNTLGGEQGKEEKEELLGMLRERIQEDPYFSSLIEIRNIEARVIFMDIHEFNNLRLKISEEVI